MYHLRRAALKALSSPSTSILCKPRTLVTRTTPVTRTQLQWKISPFQRRFASDETVSEARTLPPQEPESETFNQSAEGNAEAPIDAFSAGGSSQVADGSTRSGLAAANAYSAVRRPSQYGQSTGEGNPSTNTLYVGNLFFEVKEEDLLQQFSKFGEVLKTKIIFDHRGLSKGFGYVEFADQQEAAAAIEATNQQVFQGRRMAVQFHKRRDPVSIQSRPKNEPSKTLFIGNMSFEMSDKDLNDLFREIRNVLDVRVAIDRRSGQPRGFAHADFIDVASAQKALELLKDKEIYGRRLRVDFSQSTTGRSDA